MKIDGESLKKSGRDESSSALQRMKARIRSTETYQIFVVRAKKKLSSLLIYALLIIISSFGYESLTALLSPPLKFESLKVAQGVYEGYTKGGLRSSDKITIRRNDGEKEVFEVILTPPRLEKLNSLKGKLITVYYSLDIHPFLYKYKEEKAIKYNNDFVDEYTEAQYRNWLVGYKAAKIIVSIWVIGALVLLFSIYLMNRKH